MSSPTPSDPRTRAGERLAGHRRHLRRLRIRAVGLSLATFVAATAVVLIQLVTGHDPALARTTAAARTAARTSTARPASTTAHRTSSRVTPAAVTTRAS